MEEERIRVARGILGSCVANIAYTVIAFLVFWLAYTVTKADSGTLDWLVDIVFCLLALLGLRFASFVNEVLIMATCRVSRKTIGLGYLMSGIFRCSCVLEIVKTVLYWEFYWGLALTAVVLITGVICCIKCRLYFRDLD